MREKFSRWSAELANTLTHRFNLDTSRVVVLSESDDTSVSSTAANVRRAVTIVRAPHDARRRAARRPDRARHVRRDRRQVQPRGPGPRGGEVGGAARPAARPGRPGQHPPASFPFLERLAGPRRVIITATDSPAQRFQTVFPEFFIKAFVDDAADLDKNGRVSIWEAFAAASAGVRRYYQQRGQLSTERALLDDTGDGIGGEAGSLARTGRSPAGSTSTCPFPAPRRPTKCC
jgi:hypothetical protein